MLPGARITLPTTICPIVVGVTGHRDIVAAEIVLLEAALVSFFTDLQSQFQNLPLHLITPLADGADRVVARVAHSLNIPMTLLLPMPLHHYRQDFDAQSLLEFDEMLNYGDVLELALVPTGAPDEVGARLSIEKRRAQYEYLGVYLAAHSHILLALWDGKPSDAPGGTAHVVQFHRDDMMESVAGSNPRSPIDYSEDESDLIYHIPCSREGYGVPADDLVPGAGYWLTRDDLHPATVEMPKRYTHVFQRMEQFNFDLQQSDSVEQQEIADLSQYQEDRSILHCHRIFNAVDTLALKYQRRAMAIVKATYVMAALTGLAFIAYADLADFDLAIWGYLVFLLGGISLYLFERRAAWYRRYLDYRGLAEGLRIQFYWSLAGIPADNPTRFSHDSFMKRQDLELGWMRNVMRYAGLHIDAYSSQRTARDVDHVIERWVDNSSSGQLGYYRARTDRGVRKQRFTNNLMRITFALGVLTALILALFQLSLSDNQRNVLIALMAALPLFAIIRQNYSVRTAEQELVAQYQYMHRIYSNTHQLLAKSDGIEHKREVLRALGEAAFDETGLWLLRQRERPVGGGQLLQG